MPELLQLAPFCNGPEPGDPVFMFLIIDMLLFQLVLTIGSKLPCVCVCLSISLFAVRQQECGEWSAVQRVTDNSKLQDHSSR